jgi:hypothetical protein
MNELEAVCKSVDRLEGHMLAVEGLVLAMCEVLPADTLQVVQAFYASEVEAIRHQLHKVDTSRSKVDAFEVDALRLGDRLKRLVG